MTKPTPRHLEWAEMELGVIIHYLMDIYNPEVTVLESINRNTIAEDFPASCFAPEGWDTDQWMRSAAAMGAKYAVLVANHCTGFSLWPTKANDYSVASCAYQDGKGDIIRDFLESCKKYDIKPGLYYSTGCNGYYGMNDFAPGVGDEYFQSDRYREYVKVVEQQVKELWSDYGELFEVWFDGGVLPVEKGGPNLVPILEKYQPNTICFQGPKGFPHNVRWVGNENGLAPADCWGATNAGEARYDGTIPDEIAGVGDPDGKYFWPAETDMANRDNKTASFGGWAWKEGEDHTAFSAEHLMDCYVRSVGRNSNLLMGMAIAANGRFPDEEQFVQFGEAIRKTFGKEAILAQTGSSAEKIQTLQLDETKEIHYIVLQEDMTEGHRIRRFRVTCDGEEVLCGQCVGHKRIIPYYKENAGEVQVEILESVDTPVMRSIRVF